MLSKLKKYKWMVVSILIVIELFIFIFLCKLRLKNIDMTDMRLVVTYWKEYFISLTITILCYLGIKKVLEE